MSELDAIGLRKARNRKLAAALTLVDPGSTSSKVAEEAEPLPNPQPLTNEWSEKHYFVDVEKKSSKSQKQEQPGPNEDEMRRRNAELQTFLAYNDPPWTTPVNNRLKARIQEASSNDAKEASSPFNLDAIDFDEISARVSTNKMYRSPDACRIQARNLLQKKPTWTQEEIGKLRTIIKEFRKDQSDDEKIDWKAVVAKLGTKNRTVWDVFQTYQAKVKGRPKQPPWTPEEDEFLLKFVAAMGPQYVLDNSCASFLSARFLPDKPRNKVLARLNSSLLNPKLVNEAWGEEDERKLTLCMKVYSEQDTKQALYLAGGHIPWRAPHSVIDKWDRSLNPAYSVQPFSKKEDQELMEIMRRNPELGWKEISDQFFPRRHPHRIMNRWSEIAKDEDILIRYGDGLRKHIQADQLKEGDVDATEYVVKLKKARRS